MNDVVQSVLTEKLIAILRGIPCEKIVEVGQALFEGGFRLVEATFDQNDTSSWTKTADSIRALSQNFEGRMLVGVGTVLSPRLVDLAAESGAKFIVSPDCNARVIKRTKELVLTSIPGAFTPTEILQAHEAGADFVKIFPTSFAGADYIKAIRAPISHVKLIATGGITPENLPSFLSAGCVAAGIGSQLVSKSLADADDFDAILKRAAEFVAAAKSA